MNDAMNDGAEAERATKRADRRLKVSVRPAEAEQIEAQARAVGLSTSAYLRRVALGYQPRPLVDRERVQELAKINADQGRIGGLLKAWLAGDPMVVQPYPEAQLRAVIRSALSSIEETQEQFREVLRKVVVTTRRS